MCYYSCSHCHYGNGCYYCYYSRGYCHVYYYSIPGNGYPKTFWRESCYNLENWSILFPCDPGNDHIRTHMLYGGDGDPVRGNKPAVRNNHNVLCNNRNSYDNGGASSRHPSKHSLSGSIPSIRGSSKLRHKEDMPSNPASMNRSGNTDSIPNDRRSRYNREMELLFFVHRWLIQN